ncbi:hypothetical protein H0E87_004758 [Populus deltoides]|uniref:Protein kinase domain-containing protein n=1 Tax=Populus deltoides TaxID=3696 RepID=A0A8T2ZI71_POPDE|nr:hypothetical protein H0E87_004758 [Populus deltoides]
MINFLFSLLALSFLTSHAKAQQNYSKNSALDCNASDETGPSSAFLYSCNGQSQSCQAFLIFKSQPSLQSVPAISVLTSADEEELARINYVTRLSEFPTNKEFIVPGLSTCAALKRRNTHGEYHLLPVSNCKCHFDVLPDNESNDQRNKLSTVIIITAIVFLSCKKRRDLVAGSCRERKLVVREDLRVKIASYEQVLKVFEFEKVKKATEKFSFESRIKGSVYRGEFGGEILAVKKMRRDVIKEVNILKRVNHLNLIKLEGVCDNLGCFYLVLEYMGNGSLRELLFCKKSKESGNWTKRIQIALDVANGLNYLHSFTEPAYVHRAPLARAARKTSAALTKHVVGTRGYMAPEYVGVGQVTPKIEVYAFGVILLELITGKDAAFTQDGKESLLSTAKVSIMEKENPEAELDFYVDPGLKGICGTDFVLCLTKVSVACLMKEPVSGPNMEEVISILLKIQANVLKS